MLLPHAVCCVLQASPSLEMLSTADRLAAAGLLQAVIISKAKALLQVQFVLVVLSLPGKIVLCK